MDYTKRAVVLCFTLLVALFAISFIPPQNAMGVELRRANILSEILHFLSDDSAAVSTELILDEEEYEIDLELVAKTIDSLHRQEESATSITWVDDALELGDELLFAEEEVEEVEEQISSTSITRREFNRRLANIALTPIEDFDTTDNSAIKRLYSKLLEPNSTVRVALLGDSFVEADILSSDLREALQSTFGGSGAGFAPMASPLTAYRPTIKTESKGWQSYNIMQRRKTPAPYNEYFAVSGWVCAPTNGATTKWSATSARKHIDSCQRVRILFLATKKCSLEITINDTRTRTFDIEASTSLREIELTDPALVSAQIRVISGAEGFIGYGAIFEGESGVVVDNYSIRSNNGQAMLWTNPAINAQIDKVVGGYDLVLLQYGLNIMQKGVTRYSNYATQIEKMIAYARKCFPKAAIIVMGVSDRSMREEGEYRPMSEARHLVEYQRIAAQKSGAAFWDTHSAMQAQGGMSTFVKQGWAGKDYTHINFAGGRQCAWALYDAIIAGTEEEQSKIVYKQEHKSIIDDEADAQIRAQLEESRYPTLD